MARRVIKNEVRLILESHPELREDPNQLIAYMWKQEILDKGILTIQDVLDCLAKKRITNPETIRRSRRKVIEDNPHLRPSEAQQELNNIYESILRANRGEF